MAVYGVPIFVRGAGESRAHGNDERITPENHPSQGMLWKIVLAAAVNENAGTE